MNILIDTHIFLYLMENPKLISKKRLSILEDMVNDVYLSSISIAELMIKSSLGKITINFNPILCAHESKIKLLDFTAADSMLLKDLPFVHKDPFDRMLICQALSNSYSIMTDDEKFNFYNCNLI